jgi:hypothetical protein
MYVVRQFPTSLVRLSLSCTLLVQALNLRVIEDVVPIIIVIELCIPIVFVRRIQLVLLEGLVAGPHSNVRSHSLPPFVALRFLQLALPDM